MCFQSVRWVIANSAVFSQCVEIYIIHTFPVSSFTGHFVNENFGKANKYIRHVSKSPGFLFSISKLLAPLPADLYALLLEYLKR